VGHGRVVPVRVRFHSPELGTDVIRGVGAKITCETCGQSKRSRSWSELRWWLRWHVQEEHGQ
jgi:hypothetical protein